MSSGADELDLDAFFTGVTEVRAYLDRHLQDPARRRQRLAQLAKELLKPRGARALADFLVRQLQGAVGAESVALFIGGVLWSLAGRAPARAPSASQSFELVGAGGAIGSLRLEVGQPLDRASAALIAAICDTAGVAIEQALRVDALGRDPQTGLFSATEFTARAAAVLRQLPPPGAAHGLLAFRLEGPHQRLGAAIASELPIGTPAGERGGDVFAAISGLPLVRAERVAAALARRVCRSVQKCRATQMVSARPIDDVGAELERLTAGLDSPRR